MSDFSKAVNNYLMAKAYLKEAKSNLEKAIDYGADPAIEEEILPLVEEKIKVMNELKSDDITELFSPEDKKRKLVEV